MYIQQSSFFLNQEFSCRISHHLMIEKKVYYVILFISHSYYQVRVHRMRYSDAEKLHNKIEKTAQQLRLNVQLPTFPGKSFFGSHNNSVKGIQQRRTELQEYFNLLLREDKLYPLPCLKQLLPLNEDRNELQQFVDLDKPLQQYSFLIDTYQQLEDRVLYFVQVIDNQSKNKWRFKARYSDLRDIHEAIKTIKKNIPEFPKRKLFGITNDNPQQIEQRKKGLEQYLNSIFSDPELSNTEILDYFIQNSKRESKKLQKYDEQKMLLKMKMKAKQLQDNKSNLEKRFNPLKPKMGLFIIKELLYKYEDDNTTLTRITSLSLNYSGQFYIKQAINDQINKAHSQPLYQDDEVKEVTRKSGQQLQDSGEIQGQDIVKQADEMWIMQERQESQNVDQNTQQEQSSNEK